MYRGPRNDLQLTWQSERTGRENNWYCLTGRVVELKVEADGDLHIALDDATGDKPGVVVCEVPAKPQWCEIRFEKVWDERSFTDEGLTNR